MNEFVKIENCPGFLRGNFVGGFRMSLNSLLAV
jgi:hypothetical protein